MNSWLDASGCTEVRSYKIHDRLQVALTTTPKIHSQRVHNRLRAAPAKTADSIRKDYKYLSTHFG